MSLKLISRSVLKLLVLIAVLLLLCHYTTDSDMVEDSPTSNIQVSQGIVSHRLIVDHYYKKRQNWKTSNLGAIVFKNFETERFSHPDRLNRTYVVLIWRYYDWLKQRHVHNYHSRSSSNLLNECSVRNCVFVSDDNAMETADVVVIHIQRGRVPEVARRPSHQRWVILSDESPMNTFSLTDPTSVPSLSNLSSIFNWTMTFRSDSDIPIPYGRTIPLREPNIVNLHVPLEALQKLVPHWDSKQFDIPIAILASNCMRPRMKFFETLKQLVGIDMHGQCSTRYEFQNSCPGHFKEDCPVMAKYLFYLVYENSNCRQYLTEKSFYHGYSKGAIPIIVGPSKEDCVTLLPPNSYIHIDDYGTPEKIAAKINSILYSKNAHKQLLFYHKWRMDFEVLNEHGYFGTESFHYCRVCEALNYNKEDVSIYEEKDLQLFFNPNITCKKN